MNRKGFTLVEMLTVTVIITVIAAIVLGRAQNDRSSDTFFRGVQSIETAAYKAKNQAISTGSTYELTFDDQAQSLKVALVDPTANSSTTTTPIINKTTGKSSADTTATNSSAQDQPAKLGTGWTVATVRNPDGTTDTSLSLKFYPDGTADPKSVEFHSGTAPVYLKVAQDGTITVNRGTLPQDDKPQQWEAGNLEQRTGA